MTTTLTPPRAVAEHRFALMVAALALALLAGLMIHWAVAAALLGVVVILSVRPFEPFPALVVATVAASFVNYEGGHLTRELAVLTMLLVYALLCLWIAYIRGRWVLSRAGVVILILAFEAWTLVSTVRGVLAGNEPRYMGLELLPLAGLTVAILAGGLQLTRRDLRDAFLLLNLAALGHVALGLISYAVNRVRTGGIWFTPFPGLMALLVFNVLLRTRRRSVRFGLLLIMAADLLHQLISLTRGYWMGLAAGFALSAIAYVGRGPGVRIRALRVLGTSGWMALFVAVSAAAAGAVFGWGDLAALFGTRVASSLGTEQSSETASNMARLIEWLAVLRTGAAAPWFGHGMGYTLHVHYPVVERTSSQWFVHEHYLWIWLKQGAVGLTLVVALLWAATRAGMRGARRHADEAGAWSAGAAAVTAYIAVLGLTNYPLAQVNPTFLLALLWGVMLSLDGGPNLRIAWRVRPSPHREPGAAGT
jgi:O-antigen ligase/polysaccharide polymerase Wzy-like membrane protein